MIELGDTRLTVMETPGHTAGSSSYLMRVRENGRDYNVAIANMGTINAGKQLVVDPTYPGVADDFAATFRKQKALDVDVWVAAHGRPVSTPRQVRGGDGLRPRDVRRSRRVPRRRGASREGVSGTAGRGAALTGGPPGRRHERW